MKQKRQSTEEIIRILWEADSGKAVESDCREDNVTATSFYRWKKKYGGMELQDARRYREQEKENGELKKIVADQMDRAFAHPEFPADHFTADAVLQVQLHRFEPKLRSSYG